MTTTRLFMSSDSGAPVLTGQVGSLVSLLHACLVGTSGVAYGSGGSAKTAAGWTEPFTNTSTKGVWRNSLAAGGTGFHFRVLDDGSGTAGAKEAFFTGYSAMTTIDAGSDITPTAAQMTSGSIIRKSDTADSTARGWYMVADERTFYLAIEHNTSTFQGYSIYIGGDFDSEVAGDAYAFLIGGRMTANITGGSEAFLNAAPSLSSSASNGLFVVRGIAGTGTALPISIAPGIFSSSQLGGAGGVADPSPGGANRYFARAAIVNEGTIRGFLRGLYVPISNLTSLANGTVISGASGLASGSNLILLRGSSNTPADARVAIETSLSW